MLFNLTLYLLFEAGSQCVVQAARNLSLLRAEVIVMSLHTWCTLHLQNFSSFLLLLLETESYQIAEAGLELPAILLPQPLAL